MTFIGSVWLEKKRESSLINPRYFELVLKEQKVESTANSTLVITYGRITASNEFARKQYP